MLGEKLEADNGIQLAAEKELSRLLGLRSLAVHCEREFTGLEAAVRAVANAEHVLLKLQQVPLAEEAVWQLGNVAASVAQQPAWDAPESMLQGESIQVAAGAALGKLRELQAAVAGLDVLKQALEQVQGLGARWDPIMVSHQHRWHNEHRSQSRLLLLPPAVLRDVARRVGKGMRLVCSHVYHAYGSPGTGIRIPASSHYSSFTSVDGSFLPAVQRWSCPWEVLGLTGRVDGLAPAGFRALMGTFTQLQRLVAVTLSPEQELSLLPSSLTQLSTCSDQNVRWPLHSVSHLTALHSLHLHFDQARVAYFQQGLCALSSLVVLHINSTCTARGRQSDAPMGTEIWGPISQLPKLQTLSLDVPLTMAAPLPAYARPMQSLQSVRLQGRGGGLAQQSAVQVCSLFPPGVALVLVDVLDALDGPGASWDHLTQALARARCSKLTVGITVGCEYDVDLHEMAASLAAATPHLVDLDLDLEDHPGLAQVFFQLLQPALPLEHLQSLSLRSLDQFDPVALLNTIAPALPNVTSLTLATDDHPVSALEADFGHFMPNLQTLRLDGFTAAERIVPHLTSLQSLTSLSLQLSEVERSEADLVCLPSTCTALSSLTRLKTLATMSAKVALQPGVDPIHVDSATCWLHLVKHMSRLESLDVVCLEPLTGAEAAQLLPLGPRLKCVGLEAPGEGWSSAAQEILQGHVEQLFLTGF